MLLANLFMGSIARVEDEKEGSVCDISRHSHFGVCLVDSGKDSIIVQTGLESSLVIEVKEK